MNAELLVSVAWTVILAAAGLSLVTVLAVGGLLWVRSISPRDARIRLDTLEKAVETLTDDLRRTRSRERTAARRAEARGESSDIEDEPTNGEKQRPPDVSARLAAIRARMQSS